MSWYLDDMVKGERPTLLQADKANEVIKALNMLANMTIKKGDADGVVYEDGYGIEFTYGVGVAFEYDGTVEFLDGTDIQKKYVVTFETGTIISVEVEASGYEWKTIEICEDGSTASYEFLVKS